MRLSLTGQNLLCGILSQHVIVRLPDGIPVAAAVSQGLLPACSGSGMCTGGSTAWPMST